MEGSVLICSREVFGNRAFEQEGTREEEPFLSLLATEVGDRRASFLFCYGVSQQNRCSVFVHPFRSFQLNKS